MNRGRAVIAVLALVFSACSSATTADTTPPSTSGGAASPKATAPVATSTTTSPRATSTTSTTFPRLAFDLPALELAPVSADSSRPLLSWEPVDGAVRYHVTVFAPNGRAYWATQTRSTSVHVGGEPQLAEESAGPSVVEGMTWQVLAVDDERAPLAASERVLISP